MLLIVLQNNCDGFWAWPWPLILAFLLGLLLGWLLSKLFGNNNDSTCSNCTELQAELDACRKNAKLATSNLTSSLTNTEKKPNKIKTVVKKVDNSSTKKGKTTVAKAGNSVKDDLTKVEGIGPKIKGLLNDDGIWSWKQLSEVSVSRIQKVLDNAGPRYRVHNPETWPMQSGMCAKGEWEKLKKWQDEHKGGRA